MHYPSIHQKSICLRLIYQNIVFSSCNLFVLKYLLYFIRLELRDEWRLENRNAFANIWSDMVYGLVLFLLICFNPSKVSIYQKSMSVSVSIHFQLRNSNICSNFCSMHAQHSFFLIQNEVLNAYKQINCCATGPLVVKGVVVNLYCQFQITAKAY